MGVVWEVVVRVRTEVRLDEGWMEDGWDQQIFRTPNLNGGAGEDAAGKSQAIFNEIWELGHRTWNLGRKRRRGPVACSVPTPDG